MVHRRVRDAAVGGRAEEARRVTGGKGMVKVRALAGMGSA